MNVGELAIISVAAWRLAVFLVVEDGPFDVTLRLRMLLGAQAAPVADPPPITEDVPFTGLSYYEIEPLQAQRASWWQPFFEKLFACVWCMSLWTSIIMAAIWQLYAPVVQLVAIWGVATAIDMVARRQD